MGSARTGRRPLASPAWEQWAARRGPRPPGTPTAWDRSDKWMRCRWRRRSGSAGIFSERSGPPWRTWPGPSGSVPPGTTGPWTSRRRGASRDPVYTGSGARPTTGCRGQRPTLHAYATWPWCSEMPQRRRPPRLVMEPRFRGAVQPRHSRPPRGRPRGRRARAKRLPLGSARTHPSGQPWVPAVPQGRPC